MPYTIALIAVFAAVIVLFSSEFSGIAKKVWSKKYVKLFLPLFAASYMAIGLDEWFIHLLGTGQSVLMDAVSMVKQFIINVPFAEQIATLVILIPALLIPVGFIYAYPLLVKEKFPFPSQLMLFYWALMMLLALLM